jgi:hypothetical protein
MMDKYVDVKTMKKLNNSYRDSSLLKNPYKKEFKELFSRVSQDIFDIDELWLYVNGIGVPPLVDKLWDSLQNKSKIANIVKKEENVIYKNTLNMYANHSDSKNWINEVARKNRSYNISKLTQENKKRMENKIKKFGANIKKVAKNELTNNNYY